MVKRWNEFEKKRNEWNLRDKTIVKYEIKFKKPNKVFESLMEFVVLKQLVTEKHKQTNQIKWET